MELGNTLANVARLVPQGILVSSIICLSLPAPQYSFTRPPGIDPFPQYSSFANVARLVPQGILVRAWLSA